MCGLEKLQSSCGLAVVGCSESADDGRDFYSSFPKDFFLNTFVCCLPQSILLQWQPPPAGTHSGQITGYKIRYRKVSRKSDVTESVGGTQLSQLIEGE